MVGTDPDLTGDDSITALTGWDISWRNITDAAKEGAGITVSGTTNSSRGFSDEDWEFSGTITEVADREVHIDGDADHDYYLERSGLTVHACRVLEDKGDWTFSNIEEIVIVGGAD